MTAALNYSELYIYRYTPFTMLFFFYPITVVKDFALHDFKFTIEVKYLANYH